MGNKHTGSDFDDFLQEEGILEEVTAVAIKRAFAMALQDAMKAGNISKVAMARRLHTSRTQVDRVLAADETGTSIDAMVRAAQAVGKRLEIRLA